MENVKDMFENYKHIEKSNTSTLLYSCGFSFFIDSRYKEDEKIIR